MADEVITLVETTETIVVQQTNQQIVEVIQPPTPQIIEVVQQGVQGPPGPNTIGGYPIIMDGSANNGDVLSFSTSIMAWYNRAEQTLTDGGNF